MEKKPAPRISKKIQKVTRPRPARSRKKTLTKQDLVHLTLDALVEKHEQEYERSCRRQEGRRDGVLGVRSLVDICLAQMKGGEYPLSIRALKKMTCHNFRFSSYSGCIEGTFGSHRESHQLDVQVPIVGPQLQRLRRADRACRKDQERHQWLQSIVRTTSFSAFKRAKLREMIAKDSAFLDKVYKAAEKAFRAELNL
jgi:hypothetical protein